MPVKRSIKNPSDHPAMIQIPLSEKVDFSENEVRLLKNLLEAKKLKEGVQYMGDLGKGKTVIITLPGVEEEEMTDEEFSKCSLYNAENLDDTLAPEFRHLYKEI